MLWRTWKPSRGPFWNCWNCRNYQLVWWGWRWAFRPSAYVFMRHTHPALADVFRWSLFLGPIEIRRWVEDCRAQRRRLGLEG